MKLLVIVPIMIVLEYNGILSSACATPASYRFEPFELKVVFLVISLVLSQLLYLLLLNES